MNLLLVLTITQQLTLFSNARTLPHNWRDFIDPDSLDQTGNDQSRYSPDMWQGDVSNFEPGEFQRPQNIAANAVDKAELMWPNNTIPYVFTTERSVHFRVAERTRITEAMEIVMHLTGQCIKFVERTSETDYIKFQKGYQCFSDVGRTGGRQVVSLSSGCVVHYGCIQHELMHALGFLHEQSRLDRDDYVTINWDNIAKENKNQFTQHAGNTYGLPYDFESIMHYQFNAFAEDVDLPTILPKVRRTKLGQKENLSPLDVARIHKRFKCGVPSGTNFVVSRLKENKEDQENDSPMTASLDPFPVFSAEPMAQDQCAYQFNANCARTDYTTKNCTTTQSLEINCTERVTSAQLHDLATGVSRGPLRAIKINVFDGVPLSFDNFAVVRKQIIILEVRNCLSSRTTGKLPELQYSNLLSFWLRDCYGMRIDRRDFARSIKLREMMLRNSTIETLERDTFTDLPALRLLSLEWGYNMISEYWLSAHIRAYMNRLHCDYEFTWFRRWWSANRQLLHKVTAGEIYSIPNSWRNNAFSAPYIYMTVDCTELPSYSDVPTFLIVPTHIHYVRHRFSINEDSDVGNAVAKRTDSEAMDPFPVFSDDPITLEHCALQFTANCAPYQLTRTNCTFYQRLEINCSRQASSEELRLMATALAKTPPRPMKIAIFDAVSTSFSDFARIREQVVLFFLSDCIDNRGTRKPYKLRIVNLLKFSLINCYGLKIVRKDFQRLTWLRIAELSNSTVLTLEMGTFGDLPSLRVIALEYGLKDIPRFSAEVRDYIVRLHCGCEFSWYREWWNNNTALMKKAELGEIFSLDNAWTNYPYVKEDIYLTVDCLKPPSGSSSIKLNQIEFSMNEDECDA